jgi:hypothetical protein
MSDPDDALAINRAGWDRAAPPVPRARLMPTTFILKAHKPA